jgi:hypothetical protein
MTRVVVFTENAANSECGMFASPERKCDFGAICLLISSVPAIFFFAQTKMHTHAGVATLQSCMTTPPLIK